jgi:choline kinase
VVKSPKAIILAAGEGTRLRPLTNDRPKCLVEHQGKAILGHILDALASEGIEDITVVGGYQIGALRTFAARYPNVRVIENAEFHSTNMVHSLFSAAAELEGEVVISYADIVYRERVLQRLLATQGALAVTVDLRWRELWQLRMDDPLADAETLKLGEGGRLLSLGNKPRTYEEIEGQYIGLLKLDATGCAEAKRYYAELRAGAHGGLDPRKMFMTAFVQGLIDRGVHVQAALIEGGWLEIDTLEDLRRYAARGDVLGA